MTRIYTKRVVDKLTLSAIVGVITLSIVVLIMVIDTSKWAQATDDTIEHCKQESSRIDSKVNINKDHIRELEAQKLEEQRFRGEIEAKIDSIQSSQIRQEAMIMQLIHNSNKIINGNSYNNDD